MTAVAFSMALGTRDVARRLLGPRKPNQRAAGCRFGKPTIVPVTRRTRRGAAEGEGGKSTALK